MQKLKMGISSHMYKVAKKNNPKTTKVLLSSTVSRSELSQLTLSVSQAKMSTEVFESASERFISYWDQFYAEFNLYDAYCDLNEGAVCSLTICFKKKELGKAVSARKLMGQAPSLFATCLREIELPIYEEKVKEAQLVKHQLTALQQECQLLKQANAKEIQHATLSLEQLKTENMELKTEKAELSQQIANHEVTANKLIIEFKGLKAELEETQKEITEREEQAAQKDTRNKLATVDVGHDGRTLVPTVAEQLLDTESEHLAEEKRGYEQLIKELFKESDEIVGHKRVVISRGDQRIHLNDIEVLDYQWNQVRSSVKSGEVLRFLEWTKIYIEALPLFKEALEVRMKKSLLDRKKSVTDEATLLKLKAYSALSTYLMLFNNKD